MPTIQKVQHFLFNSAGTKEVEAVRIGQVDYLGHQLFDLVGDLGLPVGQLPVQSLSNGRHERIVQSIPRLCNTLAPLSGLPRRRLNLNDCNNIRDLTPLAECKELRELVLPPNVGEIEFLRQLPNLERISFKSFTRGSAGWTPAQTAAEFWSAYDAAKKGTGYPLSVISEEEEDEEEGEEGVGLSVYGDGEEEEEGDIGQEDPASSR